MRIYLAWLIPMAAFVLWFGWHEGYIGWTPEPPTQRSIVSVLKDPIDVRDFGAVGDGVTDNTTAFDLALRAAGGGGASVTVPPGRWLVDGKVRVVEQALPTP